MKKTTLSRWTVILFTAAMAAVNNPLIAQPQNDRLDSLNKEYSYEICRSYVCDRLASDKIEFIERAYNYNLGREFFRNWSRYIIPIARIFPDYFERKTPDIFPYYTYFSPEYGCPMYVEPKKTTNISEQLDSCRTQLDSISGRIIKIMYADSAYISLVKYVKDSKVDKNNVNDLLAAEEKRIRRKHQKTVYSNGMRRIVKNKQYYNPRAGSTYVWQPGLSNPGNRNFTGLEYRQSKGFVSYIDDYHDILYHTNNRCLALILSDHIRRGEPIDISWIPEQTLAEIEATKPVRQLKKQIKALEKQQKQ